MYASYGARGRARGNHSPAVATPCQLLRSFCRARRTSSSICLSFASVFRSRFASLFRDASRLCRRSALCRHSRLVSAGALLSSPLGLCLVFAFVLLLSLLSTLLPSLLCFRLISPRLRLSLVAWPSTNVINISK